MRKLLLLAIVTLASLAAPAMHAHAVPHRFVSLYGDSLILEAKSYTFPNAQAQALTVNKWGKSGRAPCDYLTPIRNYIANHPLVELIGIEAAGNSSTPCMLIPGVKPKAHYAIGSQAWLDKYRTDYNALFGLTTEFPNVKLLIIASPPFEDGAVPGWNEMRTTLWPLLQSDAGAYPAGTITFTDGPRNALGGDTFTSQMPCQANEGPAQGCNDGQITVRAPDGVHFCPAGTNAGLPTGCSLPYSSGAQRFAIAITNDMLEILGIT